MLREIVPTAPLYLAAAVTLAGSKGPLPTPTPLPVPIGKVGGLEDAFDALACFDEGTGDDVAAAPVVAEVEIPLPADAAVGNVYNVTVFAMPPVDPYPPLPCSPTVGGRWFMGNAHTCIPVTATIKVVEKGTERPSSSLQ